MISNFRLKSFFTILMFGLFLIPTADAATKNTVDDKIKSEIVGTMNKQSNCWNNGNIDCYMDGYWKSDSLTFIGKDGPVYGWQNTLDRYKKNYPDKATMGNLTFELISIEPLGKEAIFVIGAWKLTRTKDELSGYYSLIWKKIDGKWVIVADHSS